MIKKIENRTVIELKEKKKVMMHTLLDEILDSDNPGPIHATHLTLKAYASGVKVRQKRIELESRLREIEKDLKLIE
ncbi:MAG: hypothetical protein SRB2_02151 [Desulfobacteraceae bacterium Eth-SRB2]|nr:MAG: hypothetical protein SRB2_02151 [Desulfobacteraceae bacterium Eth-SRB2]